MQCCLTLGARAGSPAPACGKANITLPAGLWDGLPPNDGTPIDTLLLCACPQWIPSFNLYRGLYELSQVRPRAAAPAAPAAIAHVGACRCSLRLASTCRPAHFAVPRAQAPSLPLPPALLQYAFLADRTGGLGLTWSKLSDPE